MKKSNASISLFNQNFIYDLNKIKTLTFDQFLQVQICTVFDVFSNIARVDQARNRVNILCNNEE